MCVNASMQRVVLEILHVAPTPSIKPPRTPLNRLDLARGRLLNSDNELCVGHPEELPEEERLRCRPLPSFVDTPCLPIEIGRVDHHFCLKCMMANPLKK